MKFIKTEYNRGGNESHSWTNGFIQYVIIHYRTMRNYTEVIFIINGYCSKNILNKFDDDVFDLPSLINVCKNHYNDFCDKVNKIKNIETGKLN